MFQREQFILKLHVKSRQYNRGSAMSMPRRTRKQMVGKVEKQERQERDKSIQRLRRELRGRWRLQQYEASRSLMLVD